MFHITFWSIVYRYCIQIFEGISQIQHTVLHFGPMLKGTAYYLLEQCLQVLHINLRSNFTNTAYATLFWKNAHRYYILLFGAMFTGTSYSLWSNFTSHVLHFGPITGNAYYLLEQCLQVLHINLQSNLTDNAYST